MLRSEAVKGAQCLPVCKALPSGLLRRDIRLCCPYVRCRGRGPTSCSGLRWAQHARCAGARNILSEDNKRLSEVTLAKQTLSRELRAMGYRKLSARPRHHGQADGAIEDFKKTFPARVAEIAEDKAIAQSDIEIWFADEARIGQKNKITRRWARRGTRPSAPHDQRTASAYIFGAICPIEGKGAALVLPTCNTEAMNLHLAEIATEIAPGKHAILLLDQAGWHMSRHLVVPPNITLVPLPSKCPELNPQENVWQFMRDNWLSNRVFKSYDDIVDHCCFAWNKLIDEPWRIMSIGMRDWAYRF